MSAAGPELPPHLVAKRKRQVEEGDLPKRTRSRSRSSSSSENAVKQRRILGPSLPPAALDERPESDPQSRDGSGSDSDLGPALPPSPGSYRQQSDLHQNQSTTDEITDVESAKKPQREEWMLILPTNDDWSSRVDPTKLRNRKFNTGKGAKAPTGKGAGNNALWTETHEQKRQRLEDEVMGVKKPAQLDQDSKAGSRNAAEARETERRIQEYNVSIALLKVDSSNTHRYTFTRRKIGVLRCTVSIRKPHQKKRKTTQANGLSTGKRISEESRLGTFKRRRC